MEIKMSDVFGLPLNREESKYFNHLLRSSKSDIPEASFNSSDCAKYAAHAINNHDRLTEENKKLREALEKSQRLMNAFGMILVDVKRPKEDTINKLNRLISVHMDGLFSSNKKLLSELGGE